MMIHPCDRGQDVLVMTHPVLTSVPIVDAAGEFFLALLGLPDLGTRPVSPVTLLHDPAPKDAPFIFTFPKERTDP